MTNGSTDSLNTIPELDSIRGIAAFAVLICHLPRGFWFGETGVDLFFVLSGFLITRIILASARKPNFFKVFYIRRALRIFPIYYLALMVVLALNYSRSNPETTNNIWMYFLYLQNTGYYFGLLPTADMPSFGHTWTLAIEEQFYLIWPVLVLTLSKRALSYTCICLILVSPALRYFGLERTTLAGHLDGLALGALLAAAYPMFERISQRVGGLKLLIAAMVLGSTYFGIFLLADFSGKDYINSYPLSVSIISAFYMILVLWVISNTGSKNLAFLRLQPMRYVGKISYGLYLYHWIIYEWFDTIFVFGMGYDHPLWLDGLKILASFFAASLSWKLIEEPLVSLKPGYSSTHKPQKSMRRRDLARTDDL